MANIVDFLIKLKADADNLNKATQQANKDLRQVEKNAESVGAALKKAFSFDNFKSSLMSIPGMQFFTNPYAIIGSGIGAITALGAQAEQTSVAFTTLVGSEEKAADVLSQINEFAAMTPYNNLDLVGNAKTMMNFGVEADKVNEYLKELGDIAGGDSNKLNSLSVVFGQVASAGKLSGQDLLQFINAGFNPLKELQKMTGKSYAELQDMMSKGQVSSYAMAAAIQHATSEGGQFYNMSEKLSQTVSGKWSTLVGNVQQLAVSMFDKLKPAILSVIDGVMSLINFIVEWKTELAIIATAIGVAVIGLNAYHMAVVAYATVSNLASTATLLWSHRQWLLNIALNANPIGIVIAGIAALAAIIAVAWNKCATFRAVVLTVWDALKGLKPILDAIWITFKSLGSIIYNYVVKHLDVLVSKLGAVGRAIMKIFKAVLPESFSKHLKEEQAKGKGTSNKISTPGTKGSIDSSKFFTEGNKKGKNGGKSTANSLTTGGTRNTSITMTISKFFDSINVNMADKTDTAELERVVVQCMNRALAIATSTDR